MSLASVLNCSIYFKRYLLTNISTRNSLTIRWAREQKGKQMYIKCKLVYKLE